MEKIEKYLSYLRACPVCGNSWGKIEWLCGECEKELLIRVKMRTREIDPWLQHFYLIEWSSGDIFVDKLVYSLKGRGLHDSYQHLALIFSSYPEVKAPDYIYYPSKGKKDHGFQWAKTFSKLLDCPMEELCLVDIKKQSRLKKMERRKRDFIKQGSLATKPCFVDDIVTSGATARAAYRALGQPEKLTIWSLFYRRNL